MKDLPSPHLRAAVTLVAFVVTAKALDLFINRVLRKFTGITKNSTDDMVLEAIHRPVYYTVSLVGVVLAAGYLSLPENVMYYLRGGIYTTILLVWTFTLMGTGSAVLQRVIHRGGDTTGLGKDVVPLLSNVFKVAVFVASVMVVFTLWKINLSPLLASAGILGAGVAIAAKDTISNLFGGVSIFLDKPFKVGDYIVLGEGERGEVVGIGLRSTRIMTRDHIQVIVPNSLIASSKIINESAPFENFRVRVPVGVAYGSDIDLVEQTLVEIAAQNENVIGDPAPRVRFRSFGDSALLLELLCWAREPALRGLTIHKLNLGIYKRFNELGIRIPFPQRDLHIIPGTPQDIPEDPQA